MDLTHILERTCSKNDCRFHAAAFTAANKGRTEDSWTVKMITKGFLDQVLHSTTYGTQNVDASGDSVTERSMFWCASMTKIVTAVAVMVAVEKGLVGLDDDVGAILPELAEPEIIVGFEDGDDGKPILRKAKETVTLRRLLTHSSGFVYLAVNSSVKRWAEYHNHTAITDVTSRETYRLPLAFEPGKSWGYGPGVDWAGCVVEKLSNQKLGDFMQENIFQKLGITATTFHPENHPEFSARRVELCQRAPDGSLSPIPVPYTIPAKDDLGGIGLYSTPKEFTRFLQMMLRSGENVLRPESINTILSPQLECNKEVNAIRDRGPKIMSRLVNPGKVIDMGLSASINLDRVPGARYPGSISWAGAANAFWWLDMKAGICGTLFMHSFPPFDTAALDLLDELEAAVYKIESL
ncbi:putative Transesterase (LovD) [Trichophyton interdigitale]|uniref:Transesterase (LovD) n=1 Tax=Trichophyton interdigitale TaxID=101480 RepID=A0A9P4YIS5_9EURO|nr:putative Transesterase (LovD) [Trichophyton interdigitale]KAF3899199.1 putative Transesterase (LovD) [Trichophyton interdigitale]